MKGKLTGVSRRTLLKATAYSAGLATVPTIHRVAFSADQEIVVGHWGGAGPKFLNSTLVPELQKKFPNARVYIKEGGDADRRAQLEANPNAPEIDVLYMSAFDAKAMAKGGLTDMPEAAAVPEFANLHALAQDGCYGCYLHAISTAYDPAKTQPPASWLDLWKPEYKKRLLIPNTKTIVNQAFVTATIRAMGGNEDNVKDIAEARKKLLDLRPNVAVYHTGTSQALTVLKSGDAWVGVAVAGYVYQAKDAGQSVDVSYPKEGALAAIDAMTIAKKSKNKALAHAYVNLALSPAMQSKIADELYWGPTNKKAEVSEKVRAKVVHGEATVDTLVMPKWDVIMPVRAEWIDWWDKNMTS
jgi:putative spermidine/putrescine transport system substrate-binding protein